MVPVTTRKFSWVSGIAWLIALLFCGAALFLGWKKLHNQRSDTLLQITQTVRPTINVTARVAVNSEIKTLPELENPKLEQAIPRLASLLTNIPNRPRQDILDYTVTQGDAVFNIAFDHGVKPETVLWSNYDVLKDNPHAISAGMLLKIPPIDGIYYQWKEGDTLEAVASKFHTDIEKIISWSGNRIDLTDPEISPDSWIMLPDGQREFQQWIVPVIARGAAGVSTGVYGGGACPGGYEGIYGSGGFIWPTVNRKISGNDYWSGHLAIDIGSALGEPISASDSGVIVFAGWATGGYGFTVAIDHGNGYQTLYAHLNSINVICGKSVVQGQIIGYGGSSGNSTGPHLHFEIRYQGGFVNPWYVLPAP